MIKEEDVAKMAILAWIKNYNGINDDEYDLDKKKGEKMNSLIAYCQQIESSNARCSISRCVLEPKYIQGSIEVLIDGEWIVDAKSGALRSFIKAIHLCDAVNIEPFGDGLLHITFFIENLYKKKQ